MGVELVERVADWENPAAPLLGDCAYGESADLRRRLDAAGSEYVLSVSLQLAVFAPETSFEVPERKGKTSRPRKRPQPDRKPESIDSLVKRLGPQEAQIVAFRDGPEGEPVASRSLFARVRASNEWQKRPAPTPEDWLIAEWPEGVEAPTDYWLDHYEGRSWLGWHHHTALVSATHGFLTLERLRPEARRPA